MANWIDSKRFAERWPFAGAVLLIAAAALVLLLLPSTVTLPARLFILFTLDSLWSAVFEKRVGGIGYSPNRWQLILLHQAVIVPCLGAFFYGGASGSFFAVGVFLALQIPLILMRAKVPGPKPQEKPPRLGIRIALECLFCLSGAAGAAFSWRTHQPIWLTPLLVLATCYFGGSVYRLARHAGTSDEHSAPRLETVGVGAPTPKEIDPMVAKLANILLMWLGLAFINLLFREDFYGFVLPAAWMVGSILWLTFFRARRGEDLRPVSGSAGESD